MNQHIAELTHLQQLKWEKIVLNTMLIIVIAVTIALFTFFSMNPFTKEEVYEIQRKKLEELGYDNIL